MSERDLAAVFVAALDSHRDTIVLVDAEEMRIVYANQGACNNLGYRLEELIGQPPQFVFADRDAEQMIGSYLRMKSGEPSEVYRALQRRKDGSVIPVEVSRQIVQGTGARYVVGVARDISAQVEAERALRESERRLALALFNSGLAIFDWDVSSGRVEMGAQWSEIIGGESGPSVTTIDALRELAHPDDRPELHARVRQLLEGELASYRLEHRVRSQRGDWVWIESAAEVSERDAGGRALRVTGTNRDISVRRAVAEMKDAFVAAVSHELRTPLTGLIASLELLREGSAGELPPLVRDFVERAHANGERLAQLINDVLDLERAEAGRLQLQIESLDAAGLLREVARLDAAYAESFQARISIDAPPGLAISADRRRTLQVLSNLISNAAKFSPPGGEIRLAARAEAGRVVLSVADQGPGVPEEFKPRLFGLFEQASHAKGGTGLGLRICKSLVERMGGQIWCESEPGRGATFLVALPRAA
jgi:PAS domain S-box-containing protein